MPGLPWHGRQASGWLAAIKLPLHLVMVAEGQLGIDQVLAGGLSQLLQARSFRGRGSGWESHSKRLN